MVAFLGIANWPPERLPADVHADSVLILKRERKLVLLKSGEPIREYHIALGGNPIGKKTHEGDARTPEGTYIIDYRKSDSSFHKALHISYPNGQDLALAKAGGLDPGGLIMIHGLRNGLGFVGRWHRIVDWTNGCVAVTNPEIEEIWTAVPDGTPVLLRP